MDVIVSASELSIDANTARSDFEWHENNSIYCAAATSAAARYLLALAAEAHGRRLILALAAETRLSLIHI